MALLLDQLEARVHGFEQAVVTHFSHLQAVHGFVRGKPRIHNVDEPRDAAVSIRFTRTELVIEVGMALYDDRVGLVIRDPNWHLKPKPRAKAISLEDLVALVTSGAARRVRRSAGDAGGGIEAEVARVARQFFEIEDLVLGSSAALFARMAAGLRR